MVELHQDAAERDPHGEVRTEVVHDRVLVMTVDRVEKKNAFTPKMMTELALGLTRLDEDPNLWVGVLTFAGSHTTAGLEMPLFFGPGTSPTQGRDGLVDPFGLTRRLTKPLVTSIQGLTFTIGIEIALAGDIVVAASDARLCQMEPRRGIPPLGGATVRYVERAGWGNAMYHLLRADEFDAAEALRIGLVQEVVPPGEQNSRAIELGCELAASAPLALQYTIANARLAVDQGAPSAIAAITDMSAAARATEDFREGVASFVERRSARFTGA